MIRKVEKLVLILAVALLIPQPALAEVKLNSVERALPEFELLATDGSIWNRERLLDKPYIVNFWASWCAPCVEELPALNRLWSVLKTEAVGMLAINAGEGKDDVGRFLEKIAIDFPVVLGSGRSLTNWGGRALPTTLVVNRKGEIVYEAAGPRPWDDTDFVALMLTLR